MSQVYAPYLETLAARARVCDLCADFLPLGPRPVFQISAGAKILIAAQAPGTKVHASGRPFTDASGERLREWMGITADTFYDSARIAIVPMGFCYPGRGKSGDLPPRRECASTWRESFMNALTALELSLVIGQYARAWHLPNTKHLSLTATVRRWREHGPSVIALPHPSPRNNIWLKKNPWFESEVLPYLAMRVREVLGGEGDSGV